MLLLFVFTAIDVINVQGEQPSKKDPFEEKLQQKLLNITDKEKNAEQEIQKKTTEEKGYIINFDNVAIIEYIRWISEITHTNFIFDKNDLDFNITFISKEPASIDVIMASLLQILHIHDLTLLEQGNNVIIFRSTENTASSTVLSDKVITTQDRSVITTKVFQLINTSPSRIANIIKPLLSKNALIEVAEDTKHIIITDITSNIIKTEELLKSLDQPNQTLDIEIYKAKTIPIQELARLAQEILSPFAKDNSIIIVPNVSANSIFIVSTPYLLKKHIPY